MKDARAILAEAQVVFVDKSAALDGLKAARERAREFAGEQARVVEGLAGEAHDISSARSDAIKRALLAGAVPMFEAAVPAISENAVRMADAQSRLAAARLALEDLDSDLQVSEAAVTKARDGVRLAITLLLADEANSIAEEIERLERDALMLRARLGGPLGVVGQLRTGLSPAVGRVMNMNNVLEAAMLTPAGRSLSIEATRARRVWQAFAEALEADADAELVFESPATEAPSSTSRAA